MTRCAAGDEAAFGVLYERHHRLVYNIAYRMLGNPTDAEDILPDVFVKAWTKAGDFRGGSQVSTWLYRIAANMAMDRLRSGRHTKEVFWDDLPVRDQAMPDVGGESDNPERVAIRHDDERRLNKALGMLSKDERLLVTLYHLQGCSYTEVEEITGISTQNIKSRLFRARRRLKGFMEELEEGHAPGKL